jgi:catechol 2,3-dioxygenase
MYHFGLRVGDSDADLKAALDRVMASGATVLGSSDHTVTHSLYIADPDGNEVELYIDVPGVDWKSDPRLIATPTRPLVL